MLKIYSPELDEFISLHSEETHTGQEWIDLALAAGLNQDEINQLMDYLDDAANR
ncbi:hypothetical protein [Kamptonema sp. UHCC 0994]|uniref:hypothetical protein n=1 Tax=Kamptonema sp. UHCC 0994 TaxID=3031329 RepID=UPI0023BA8E7E|nr:hypothetical protein [Kamptonema sp. UHCC 0994]MDF0556395.1 hypothetical protein [Kamptonema sp. UHCC 0994]